MRAREFIKNLKEADMHHYHHSAIPGAKTFPGMGQSYDMYRFSVAMAGAPEHFHDMHPGHDATDNPTTISYSSGDEDIINAALKKMGRDGTQVSSKGSKEPEDTHTQSPVVAFKGVKRKNDRKNQDDGKGVY